LWEHRLSHEFPYGYLASDAFQHQIRAEAIKDAGNYVYDADYVAGGNKDAIGFYMPILNHLAVLFSNVTGLEVYDSILFLVFFFISIVPIIFYLIVRGFSKSIATIVLPFSLLIFSPGAYSSILWGNWPNQIGFFFLSMIFLAVYYLKIKGSFLWLGIFLAGAMLSHASEAYIGVLFVGLYLLLILITKKFEVKILKRIVFAGIIAFIFSAYYYIIFRFTLGKLNPVTFGIVKEGLEPTFQFSSYGWPLIMLFVVGIVFSFMLFKKGSYAIFVGAFITVLGLGNYFGIGRIAFRIRALWPIFTSLFIGIAIYMILKFAIRKHKLVYAYSVALIFLLIFSGYIKIPSFPYYQPVKNQGMMDMYHWEAYKYLEKNTDREAKVMFLYGDTYSQTSILRSGKRVHYLVYPKEINSKLNDKVISRYYISRITGDNIGSYYAYRKSLFDFGYHYIEDGGRDNEVRERDICNVSYVVFDMVGNQQALAEYNKLIANHLVNNDWIKPVFNNGVVGILYNENIGKECIPDEGIKIG
jgi:hypothetical protein